MRLLRSALTVSFWTMASRILGLVRDLMIGAYLGSGPVADAFVAALALPNMFRRFFAEGAFNFAFVPMFAKRLEQGDDPLGFARSAFSLLAAILIGLSVLATIFMPALVWIQVSGYAADERFDMTVELGRIVFVYILFISLAALLSGVLNASGRFAAAAAAPVLLNVFLIAGMVLAVSAGWDIGRTMAWAVVVAGIGQFALVWWAAARAGFVVLPQMPRWTPEMARLFQVMGPAILAGGVVQINLLVGRQVASGTEGAVTWLYFADRLYQLPLGVIGIAIGIVLLPNLTRRLAADDAAGAGEAYSRATELALFFTLPAAAALVAIPVPLVSVLFERGAFEARDTAQTAAALAIYGAGLPAFVLQKTMQPVFFAREDTKSPFRYALVAMVVNAAIAVGLMPVIGFLAAALGASVAAWAMVGLLYIGSRRFGPSAKFDARAVRRTARALLATLIMAGAAFGMAHVLADVLVSPGLRYVALATLVAGSLFVYLAAAFSVGAISRSDLQGALRRRR